MPFSNCYEDAARAAAYSQLEFANTYYLAYRDLPAIIGEHARGNAAVDFGCGTGRSTRFLRQLGFEVVGVDISPQMIAKARELDPAGDYRLMDDGTLSQSLGTRTRDLVLSAFTFDNVPGPERKIELLRQLAALLKSGGKIVNLVSTPEIYVHEWASFSTKDYPENRRAQSGDIVRIVSTELPDTRPVEDILWTDESYRAVYEEAGLRVLATYKPLATGEEPYRWINETKIAPWVIYVLGHVSQGR